MFMFVLSLARNSNIPDISTYFRYCGQKALVKAFFLFPFLGSLFLLCGTSEERGQPATCSPQGLHPFESGTSLGAPPSPILISIPHLTVSQVDAFCKATPASYKVGGYLGGRKGGKGGYMWVFVKKRSFS